MARLRIDAAGGCHAEYLGRNLLYWSPGVRYGVRVLAEEEVYLLQVLDARRGLRQDLRSRNVLLVGGVPGLLAGEVYHELDAVVLVVQLLQRVQQCLADVDHERVALCGDDPLSKICVSPG